MRIDPCARAGGSSHGARGGWSSMVALAGALLLAGCSGEDVRFKSPAAVRGLEILEAGLEPVQPRAFERVTAWAELRDAVAVRVHIAHVAPDTALESGYVPEPSRFVAFELASVGTTPTGERFEVDLGPRPPDRVLFYWLEAEGADGMTERWPAAAPSGALAVSADPIDTDPARVPWPEPFVPLACAFDRGRFDNDFASPGPAFPAINDPIFRPSDRATLVFVNGLGLRAGAGIGMEIDGQAYFFPLVMMLWSEVSNFPLGAGRGTLSYCPLTDTAVGFAHDNTGRSANWGTAGLYNSNLILLDPRAPASVVPQMLAMGLVGSREGECIEVVPTFLSRLSTWQALHPDTLVLDGDATLGDFGWADRDNPYRDYWADNSEIRAQIKHVDTSHPIGLQNKDRVFGILGEGQPAAFALPRTHDVGDVVRNDVVGGRPTVVVYSANGEWVAAFDRRLPSDGRELEFRRASVTWKGLLLLEDDQPEPSLWLIDGRAVAGPLAGERLAWVPSMRAFWFAWHTMYPDSRVEDLANLANGSTP